MKKILPFLLVIFVLPATLFAQVTTSNISGVVKNTTGTNMAGATVTALHVPTGTVYSTATRSGGQYDISNMNPGGPYTITVSFVGFQNEIRNEVYLILGETYRQDFKLTDKTDQLTEVVLTSTRSSSAKNGTETTIGRDRLAVLPTIGRNINDFVRFTPQAKTTGTGGISIGGQNNRFNGFLIDGAVNNDVFGVSEQGTNGGRSNTPPISIDAVDQIVVQVSPFDASLGNFTGGAINAITKSGTNDFHGSAYYIFRNENLAGKTPGNVPDSARTKLAKFNNKTYGFTLGGPILKNRAFFFINAEKQKDERLQPYLVSGNSAFNVADTVNKLVNHLKTKYGYDPGDWLNNPDIIDRTNINTRFDVNVNSKNKLTLSYRYTKAERTNPSRSSYNGTSGTINFTNNAEVFPTTQHSGNLELNTKFNNRINNKFRVSGTDVVDDRTFAGSPFPFVLIRAYDNGPAFQFGSEFSSTANLLKQRIINFYDAFKLFVGKNAFTIGADIDFNKSYNLFMNRNFGAYEYSALGPNGSASQINPLTAFIEDRGPSRYRRQYSLVDDGNKGGDANVNSGANFKSTRIGFFINDDIKVNNQLTLTFGLRADKTTFNTDVPTDTFFNASAIPVISKYYDLEGAKSGERFEPKLQLSPRFGFKYNIDEENITIRGGIGIFGGRTPLVWPGGVYQNNGITIGALDTARTTNQLTAAGTQYGIQLGGVPVGFRPDVDNQFTQTDFGLSPSLLTPQGDMNIIAKDFHLPAVMKISLAADKRLDRGWTISTEALFTKNIYEVDWVNVNFQPLTSTTTSTGPDKRPVYSFTGNPNRLVYRPTGATAAIRNPYTNVILVRNTSGQKGFAYNFTVSIDKQSRKGFSFNAAYTFGNSLVHNEATSSINTSNWQNLQAVSDRNNLPLTQSDFSLGHRVFAFVSKKFTYAKKHAATTIALLYNGQSGNAYSFTMSNRSFIGDGVTNNDLMYVPTSRAEMDQMTFITRLTGATAAQNAADITAQKNEFEEFILSNSYLSKRRGKYAERNGARLPFNHILDMNITQEFSLNVGKVRHAVSVRLDMFNVANLLDKNAGRQYFLNFDQAQVLSFEGFSGTNPTYKFQKPASSKVGLISDGINASTSSRWNGQLTFRYSF